MEKKLNIVVTKTCRCSCIAFPHAFWDYIYGTWWRCRNYGGWWDRVPGISGQKA